MSASTRGHAWGGCKQEGSKLLRYTTASGPQGQLGQMRCLESPVSGAARCLCQLNTTLPLSRHLIARKCRIQNHQPATKSLTTAVMVTQEECGSPFTTQQITRFGQLPDAATSHCGLTSAASLCLLRWISTCPRSPTALLHHSCPRL